MSESFEPVAAIGCAPAVAHVPDADLALLLSEDGEIQRVELQFSTSSTLVKDLRCISCCSP